MNRKILWGDSALHLHLSAISLIYYSSACLFFVERLLKKINRRGFIAPAAVHYSAFAATPQKICDFPGNPNTAFRIPHSALEKYRLRRTLTSASPILHDPAGSPSRFASANPFTRSYKRPQSALSFLLSQYPRSPTARTPAARTAEANFSASSLGSSCRIPCVRLFSPSLNFWMKNLFAPRTMEAILS